MRIALIDASLFTLPYDAALMGGLRAAGHTVSLHGRRARAEDGGAAGLAVTPSFYPVAGLAAMRALPKPLRLGIKGIDHAVSMARLRGRLRAERPDVIHFQWLPLPLVDGRLLGGLHALAPLVLTMHDSNPFNGDPATRLQRHGLAAALRRFDRLIVHTEQGRARLVAQGIAEDRLALLPHGLLAAPGARGGAAEPATDALCFVLFGKIRPYKGADILIDAFARLAPPLRARARVRIVGQPYMDLAPLRAQAARLGVADRIAIEPRFVADAAIAELFGPGTVATFPYREIEASGVLSLAIAHARPLLASRLGGFAETIRDGTDGLLVPPGDVAALAGAMTRFIAEPGFAAACAGAVAGLAGTIPDWTEIAHRTVGVYRAAGGAGAAAASRRADPGPAGDRTGDRALGAAPPRPSAGGRP